MSGRIPHGCVAKIGAASGSVRDRVSLLSSPCPSPTPTRWRGAGAEKAPPGTTKCEIILLCVRWDLTYPLSYRQVAEMVLERGLDIHPTTVFRARTTLWTRIRQALPFR